MPNVDGPLWLNMPNVGSHIPMLMPMKSESRSISSLLFYNYETKDKLAVSNIWRVGLLCTVDLSNQLIITAMCHLHKLFSRLFWFGLYNSEYVEYSHKNN